MTAGAHWIEERKTPINYLVTCTCGWTYQTTRRQNAWARAAKIRGAVAAHSKEIESNG